MTRQIQITIRGLKHKCGNRFRTFFMAKQLGLSGLVREDQEKLVVEAEGEPEKLNELVRYFERAHPGGTIQIIETTDKKAEFLDEFLIL